MASPPSAGATLHPSFGAIGEACQAAIAARSTQFFDERICDGFSGLPWPAGTVSTRCCRRAATAYARSCQAESAGDTPLPLAASSKGEALLLPGTRKARGLGLLHGRRLAHADYHCRRMEIVQALTPGQVAEARSLLREYERSLDIDLCFQGFDQELAGLPGAYAPPRGRLLLALD